MTQEGNKALQLVIEKTTGRYIDASINAAGSLYVTGVDDGPLTSAFFGKLTMSTSSPLRLSTKICCCSTS